MRGANILIFDEHINGGVSYLTDESFNDKLGFFDQLALMAVADDVATSATAFKVQIQHSANGRNWLSKGSQPEIGGSSGFSITANAQTPYYGKDDGAVPSLAHVRLKIDLATGGAHVRIYVTGRSWGNGR